MAHSLTVIFGVRNDKNRGILIETLESPDSNVYFFKYHDQPLDSHCDQIQRIIKAANVKRTKKMRINITEFSHEYYHQPEKTFMFKSTKLNSVHRQIEKVYTAKLNKDIGAIKRSITVANNRQAKIDAKNQALTMKMATAERSFQEERARRLDVLFGQTQQVPRAAPKVETGGSSGSGLHANQLTLPSDSDDMDEDL